ncbi:MAG: ABC transporter ATP-binding protein [Candidatus Nanopelagicales bacterium]|nr:ABC transporter ATP-binding protein [Candidatus Nanopelagicales bacterium]MDZ4249814.1 ABC transporter ATP-binding protein [Candidatus Nanopelagicales bacterium]
MSGIDVSALTADYGRGPVLDGLNLRVESGEFLAVLGESGSGKTTLLRVLAGFLRPSAGSVTFGDRVVAGPGVWIPPERRHVGIVPQEGALFPHLDVVGNVIFGLRGRRDARERAAQVLTLVGMSGYARTRPQDLSGGQQQRVALARAIAPEPEVLLLDEPFSALDASLRVRLREEVRSLLNGLGTTTVLVTHDQEEALSIAHRVALVREGQIVQNASPSELYESPTDLAAARFVGDLVELPGVMRASGLVECALGRVRSISVAREGQSVVVALRPEQLAVFDAGDQSSAEDGPGVLGHVTDSVYHGHDSVATVSLDTGDVVRARVPGPIERKPGDRVRVVATGEARTYRS